MLHLSFFFRNIVLTKYWSIFYAFLIMDDWNKTITKAPVKQIYG